MKWPEIYIYIYIYTNVYKDADLPLEGSWRACATDRGRGGSVHPLQVQAKAGQAAPTLLVVTLLSPHCPHPPTTAPLLIDSSAQLLSSFLQLTRAVHLPSIPTNSHHGDAAGAGPARGRRGGVAAAVGGGGGQLHGGRRQGLEPRRGLHGLGQEAQAILQGRLAHLRVPDRARGRGAGGRGGLRQVRQGRRPHQLQQGHLLRLPAQGGQGLLLHLQLRLLLLRHEAPRHRQVLRLLLRLRRQAVRRRRLLLIR